MTVREYCLKHNDILITIECARFSSTLFKRVKALDLIDCVCQSQVVINESIYDDEIIITID